LIGTGATNPYIASLFVSPFQAHPFAEPMNGKNYVRARWYDPVTGTWLTPDPLGYHDSSNLYAYAGGDPVNGRDPTGLLCDKRKGESIFSLDYLKRCSEDVMNVQQAFGEQIVFDLLITAGRAVAGAYGTGKMIVKTAVGTG